MAHHYVLGAANSMGVRRQISSETFQYQKHSESFEEQRDSGKEHFIMLIMSMRAAVWWAHIFPKLIL